MERQGPEVERTGDNEIKQKEREREVRVEGTRLEGDEQVGSVK